MSGMELAIVLTGPTDEPRFYQLSDVIESLNCAQENTAMISSYEVPAFDISR